MHQDWRSCLSRFVRCKLMRVITFWWQGLRNKGWHCTREHLLSTFSLWNASWMYTDRRWKYVSVDRLCSNASQLVLSKWAGKRAEASSQQQIHGCICNGQHEVTQIAKLQKHTQGACHAGKLPPAMRCPQVISWWNTADTGHLLARHRNHRAVSIFAYWSYWLMAVGSGSPTLWSLWWGIDSFAELGGWGRWCHQVRRCAANCVWMNIEGSWWYGCEKLWTCCYTLSEDVAALVLCTFPAAGTDTFGRGKICECWEMLLLCFNMRANRRRRKQSSFSRNARRMILVLTSCRHNIWCRVYDFSGPGPASHDPVHCASFYLTSSYMQKQCIIVYHCINLQQFDWYYNMILIALHKDTHPHTHKMCVHVFIQDLRL